MKHMKKYTAVFMAMMLSLCLFTACGSEEQSLTSEPSEKTAKLSEPVEILVAEGMGDDTLTDLSGDYKVTKEENTETLTEKLKAGDYDFAVLNPVDAAKLYSENECGFKAVTTLSLGDFQIAKNNYEKGQFEDITSISGYMMYGVEGGMEGELLRALMDAHDRSFYTGQIRTSDEELFVEQAGYQNALSIGSAAQIKKVTDANNEAQVVFDLASLWQESFKSDIPEYILIVSDSFANKRADDIPAVAGEVSPYGESTRGISLIKKFNKVMEKHNPDALGGEIPEAYYYYK